MTVSLRLTEYYWDGSSYATSGTTLTFSPGPKSITKSVEVQWRVAHRGRRKLKKAKFRTRETITWNLQGSCQGSYSSDALANLIEFYSKRNSKFQVVIDSNTPQIFLCPNPAGANAHTWEIVFVVFKNVKFTQTEGRIGWLDYTIDLERVNCENITGYTDPWTCTV
jgi:hypothetical protein